MKKATDPTNLLDDLPNFATQQSYHELASAIFVPDSNPTSRVEAWRQLSAASSMATRERQLDIRDNEVGELKPLPASEKASVSAFQSPRVDHPNVNTSTIINKEDLKAYSDSLEGLHAFFIRKRNSYSALSVSQSLFEQLCDGIDIPPQFRDYLIYFGKKEHEVEIAPPPLRMNRLAGSAFNHKHQWQIMGIVRFMEINWNSDVSEPSLKWSIRQTAVFCRFNDDQTHMLWLFISIPSAVEEMLKSVWSSERQADNSPLRSLYVLYHFAVCNWRPYVVALVRETEQHEMEQLGTNPEDTGPVPLAGSEERQALLILEKKVLTAKLAIQTTKGDLQLFRDEVQRWSSEPGGADMDDHELGFRFADSLRDLEVNLLRIEQLHARLQGITNLVSSFLDLSSGHALQVLTQESKVESQNMRILNERMADLAEKNTEEAATVSVLAVLTLVYLPFTVVSNFFSTSFVGVSSTANHINVTPDWWILFAVSIPLTILTIYAWRVWAEIHARERYPFWWSLLGLKKTKRRERLAGSWNHEYSLRDELNMTRRF